MESSVNRLANVRQLVASFRPVNVSGLTPNQIVSVDVATVFRNASAVAELAQAWADPRGKGPDAKLCREIIKLSADIKLDLIELMSRRLTQAKSDRLLNEVKHDYQTMKNKMSALGEKSVPGLGLAIPHLI